MSETAEAVPAKGQGPAGDCSVLIVPKPLSATLSVECTEALDDGIIAENESLSVLVRLCIKGDLRRHLCGELCLKLAWESCGSAPEGEVKHWIELDPCLPEDKCYEHTFTLPGSTFQAGDCGTMYCFCVTMSSRMKCEDGRTYTGLIHGFCKELCCIMVRPA